MTFAEVDQRYQELKQQHESGVLSEEQFDETLKALMIQDEQGRWWAKARDSGQWNYYDATAQQWVPATPPSSPVPSTPPPMPQTTGTGMAQQSYGQPAPQPYAGAAYGTGQPEISSGLKIVFYILSFLVPIVGIVLYFVYKGKPSQEDRSAANMFLILGLVSFALSCICGFVFPIMLGFGNY